MAQCSYTYRLISVEYYNLKNIRFPYVIELLKNLCEDASNSEMAYICISFKKNYGLVKVLTLRY